MSTRATTRDEGARKCLSGPLDTPLRALSSRVRLPASDGTSGGTLRCGQGLNEGEAMTIFAARYDLRRPPAAPAGRDELYAAAVAQAGYCDGAGFDTLVL